MILDKDKVQKALEKWKVKNILWIINVVKPFPTLTVHELACKLMWVYNKEYKESLEVAKEILGDDTNGEDSTNIRD